MSVEQVRTLLAQTREYLTEVLLPFWIERSPDSTHGGFLTHFDRDGKPTGATEKTFLMQIRMLYSMSAAHRSGYGDGRCAELARMGADFLLEHYEDHEHGGWFWSADRSGTPTDRRKIGYGQCFAMYAFGEYYFATADARGRAAMQRTYDLVMQHMADSARGGYFEIMGEDWQPAGPGRAGGDRKSFDVHMHMMEALTTVCDITGEADHRRKLREVMELLTGPMLDPQHGTGIQQFSLDLKPLPAIHFDVAWGRDEDIDSTATPVEVTSFGHNVEFAWLLLRAADALGLPHDDYRSIVTRLFEHCIDHGIDREHGGVYIEGTTDGRVTSDKKQFWQHAEVLVGMLAAFELTGDQRYWNTFVDVYAFVFHKFVHRPGGGEWFNLLARDGTPLWNYLADHYKISYHTVRAMIEVVRRLEGIDSRRE